MESLQVCLRQLRREITAYLARIRALRRIPMETFPKLLIPYYEGLIRTNMEVIAILERQNLQEKEKKEKK